MHSHDADEVSSESDSESEANDARNVEVPSGYDHTWLVDFTELAGPANLPEGLSEVDYFFIFFTDELFDFIVMETNRFAEEVRRSNPNLNKVN